MRIYVSSLEKSDGIVKKYEPSKVVSVLGPGTPFPAFNDYGQERHLKIELDDIRKPVAGHVPPSKIHIQTLIGFLEKWDPQTPLLAHCWAGISRSSATAFIAACMHNKNHDEQDIADMIADNSPTAFPNTLMVSLADDILGREGRMAKAAQKICADETRKINIYTIDQTNPFSIPAVF